MTTQTPYLSVAKVRGSGFGIIEHGASTIGGGVRLDAELPGRLPQSRPVEAGGV